MPDPKSTLSGPPPPPPPPRSTPSQSNLELRARIKLWHALADLSVACTKAVYKWIGDDE